MSRSSPSNCSPTFVPSVLKLDYNAFTDWTKINRSQLSAEDIAWLNAWESYDLACSPMDDDERRMIRMGHNLGWWAHSENTECTNQEGCQ